jgi:hypothetical protein
VLDSSVCTVSACWRADGVTPMADALAIRDESKCQFRT